MGQTTRYTLIERVKNPDNQNAWQTFTETYAGYIKAVLIKVGVSIHDVNDIRQEIILKLWKKLPTFEYEPKKAKFRSWLYQVIRNTAYTYLSSQGAKERRDDSYFHEAGEHTTKLTEMMEKEWKSFICEKALNNLRGVFNEQSIEVFEASLKGRSVKDLAKYFKIKENTVYRIKNRVKERLILEINLLRDDLE